jgi:hypothetical protein
VSVTDAIAKVVIAGLDPAIHRVKRILDPSMDARVKPAHDEMSLRSAR